MTEEKKTEENAAEEDWGVEKPKGGIAIETKVGLCLICILLSAFGLVVYQKINRPQEDVAINSPAEENGEQESAGESDPFANGESQTENSDQLAGQGSDFTSGAGDSGFSTPQDSQNQETAFTSQETQPAGGEQLAQNEFDNNGFDNFDNQSTFNNQSEPAPANEMAANQTNNGFESFDQPAAGNNEFGDAAQNDFNSEMPNQSEPATFDNSQADPFAGGDQFAQQQPGNAAMQNAAPQNDFNAGADAGFPPEPAGTDSGLMEQPAANEFGQADTGATGAVPVEEDPFGAASTEPAQAMPQQAKPAIDNEFGNFDVAEGNSSAQMQNSSELPPQRTKVNITEISSQSEPDPFGNAGFDQTEPQTTAGQMENTNEFGSQTPAATAENFEQPQASEFSEPQMAEGGDRFGDFRAEEFSAEQAESVTTVKRPAASIDSGTFEESAMTAERAGQARGLFDGPAPTQEVSTQEEFGALQQESFNQPTAAAVGGEYVVQNGENFWTISKKLYGTGRYFQLLARINKGRVSDPRKMRPGLKLIAPNHAAIEAQYQASHKTSQTTVSEFSGSNTVRKPGKPSGFFISQDGRPMYRVGGNDTLTDISQRHLGRSSRWYQIYQMNRQRLQNPNKLQIGTELQLPYDASRVSLVPGNSSSR